MLRIKVGTMFHGFLRKHFFSRPKTYGREKAESYGYDQGKH